MLALRGFALLLVSVLCLAGCQNRDEPQLTVGVSQCHRCAQVIAAKSWAAADYGPSGAPRLFDDPGCLIATRREGAGFDATLLFQDRTDNGAWIEGRDAWFARVAGQRSPAGYDWGAYASFADAQDAVTAAGGGRIVRFEQAIELIGTEAE